MKRFLRFAALLSALALLGACDDNMYVTPLEVTNNNIAGTWQLAEWNGAPLAEGSFVYIEFIRKDAKYVMYQNLDSFGTRKLTGRFVIDNDAELGAVIRGSYDYGAGDWAHRYIVTDFTETSMVWTAKDDRSDVQVFVRCDGRRRKGCPDRASLFRRPGRPERPQRAAESRRSWQCAEFALSCAKLRRQ